MLLAVLLVLVGGVVSLTLYRPVVEEKRGKSAWSERRFPLDDSQFCPPRFVFSATCLAISSFPLCN